MSSNVIRIPLHRMGVAQTSVQEMQSRQVNEGEKLVAAMVKSAGIKPKQARVALEAILDGLVDAIVEDVVELSGKQISLLDALATSVDRIRSEINLESSAK